MSEYDEVTELSRCRDDIARLTAEVATLRQRCGRLRELALASVRPQGLVPSPESVRWFNAQDKCFRHNDLTQGGSDGK